MGGKKKKNLANKLAKMSDEERARYMQQRADVEEEARRRKEQLIATFMKNKLKREEAFARLNLAKINQHWHQVLRKSKCQEMKDESEHLRKWIERTLNLKNRNIDNLVQELDEAEEQYCTNLQAHLDYIDNIIEIHLENISKLNKGYEEERDDMIEYSEYEKEQLMLKADSELEYLKTVAFAQSSLARGNVKKEYEEHMVKKEEMICEYRSELNEMIREKEKTSSTIWREIAAVVRGYVQETDKNRAHFAELMQLDAKSAVEISIGQERIISEETKLEKYRLQQVTLRVRRSQEIKDLEEKIKYISKSLLENRKFLTRKLHRDEKNLRHLSDISNKTLDCLEKFKTKGEQILFLIQTCSKLETESEKLQKRIKWETVSDLSEIDDNSINTDKSDDKPKSEIEEVDEQVLEEEEDVEDESEEVESDKAGIAKICAIPKIMKTETKKGAIRKWSSLKEEPPRVLLPKIRKQSSYPLTLKKSPIFPVETPELLFEKVRFSRKEFAKTRSKSSQIPPKSETELQSIILPSSRPKTAVDLKKVLTFRSLDSLPSPKTSSIKDKTIKEITIRNDKIRIRKTKSAFSTRTNPTPKIADKKQAKPEEIFVDNPPESVKFMKQTYDALKHLEGLWDSYNLVYLDLKETKEEKKALEAENKNLRGMIRSILEAAMLDKTVATNSRISTRVGSRYQGSSVNYLRTIDSAA